MASLLEFIIQNQRPQGGLLGGGGTPPQANPLGAMVGAQQAAGGGRERTRRRRRSRIPAKSDSLLTDEDRDALRQQQFLQTGLGVLSADPSQGDISRIAQGALLGVQGRQQSKQDLLDQKVDMQELAIKLREEQQKEMNRIRRGKLFSSIDLSDPEQRTEAMEQLMAAGDFEGADRLNTFESNMPDGTVLDNGREQIVVDTRTMEVKGRFQTPDSLPEGTRIEELPGGGKALVAMDTGEEIKKWPASIGLSPEELRERQDTIFKRTDKLADDFRSETGNLQQSVALGRDALQAPRDDPAAQQTLVIALNKLLDPGSVVRQSEFARVQEIGGFKSEAQTFANRLAREGQLPPEVEDTLRAEIARLSETNQARLGEIADQYIERAEEFGINPRYVVRRGLQPEPQEEEDEENVFLGGEDNFFGDL